MLSSTLLSLALAAAASAHTIFVYPGTRGNNLITNDAFPYGMQWMYPCGGLLPTTNRTFWPTTGGAISWQPGWFQGHASAFMYVNLGFGTDGPNGGPPNMSNPMVPPFQLLGPSKNPYPGTVCLPQVPLPAGANVKAGDNATIQLVELAVHGASLYTCVDITFVEPNDPRLEEVNETNCFNSSDIGFADVYTITTRTSGGQNVTSGAEETFVSFHYFGGRSSRSRSWLSYAGWLPAVVGGLWVFL